MADRITKQDFDNLATMLNRVAGTPQSFNEVGNFHFDRAYGGVKLVQVTNASGGVRGVLGLGYKPARETYQTAYSYLTGLEDVWTKKVTIKDVPNS